MLEQILRTIKNYFIREVWRGTFTIESGNLADVSFLQDGQYFKVYGSIFNDGVYQYPADNLKDEQFAGEVWALAVPPAVIALSEDITAWCDKNKDVLDSPFSSESFGGYSYAKASSGNGGTNGTASSSWQSAFASRLNEWRKIRYEFAIRSHDYVRNSE